jgi:DNA-directed RNA polymerase specialized sigma24 family protein
MISALQIHHDRGNSEKKDLYATAEDYQHLFATEMGDLFHLSLQLTADAEKAESCLIFAMKDCFSGTNVSKEWAHTWARRMVVRNAIQLILGKENETPSELLSEVCTQPSRHQIEVLRDSAAILGLPDFDRLAFVICVLERYSILDAALLMRKTPRDVNDAILRATNAVVYNNERNHPGTTGTFRTETDFNGSYGWGEFNGECGTILE